MLSQFNGFIQKFLFTFLTLNLIACGGGTTPVKTGSDVISRQGKPARVLIDVTEKSPGIFLINWWESFAGGIATSFKIDRTADGGLTYTPINLNYPADAVMEVTDSTILKGTAYQYRIIAVNADGLSDPQSSQYLTAGVITLAPRNEINVIATQANAVDGALAISPDGNSIALGLPAADLGAVRIENASWEGIVEMYTKSGVNWTLDTKLTATSPERDDSFGTSVSFNNTGSVLAVGSVKKPVSLITKTGISWATTSMREVLGADIFFLDNAYNSAFSPDGMTFAITGGQIYSKTALGNWQVLQELFIDGTSIAFSPDSSILAIGNQYHNASNIRSSGIVRIYKKINSEWVVVSELFAKTLFERGHFGSDLIFSGDGKTLAVLSNSSPRARQARFDSRVNIFTLSGTQWKRSKVLYGTIGLSVSINFDGSMLLAGNRVYKKMGPEWQMTHILTRKKYRKNSLMRSVLSSDGTTAIIYFNSFPDALAFYDLI